MAGRRWRWARLRAGRSSARANHRPRAPATSISTTSPEWSAARESLSPVARGGARVGEVHAQVAFARGPHRAQGSPQMPSAKLRVGEGLLARGLGHQALGQVEALLEMLPRVDLGAAAHPEVVERVRGGLPVPPAPGRAGRAAVREVGIAHGTVGGDRRFDRAQDRAVLLEPVAPGAACGPSSRASRVARPESATREPGMPRAPNTRRAAGDGRRCVRGLSRS